MRVSMASTTPTEQLSAGTKLGGKYSNSGKAWKGGGKEVGAEEAQELSLLGPYHPICAMMASKAIIRAAVLLPPMLGPVSTMALRMRDTKKPFTPHPCGKGEGLQRTFPCECACIHHLVHRFYPEQAVHHHLQWQLQGPARMEPPHLGIEHKLSHGMPCLLGLNVGAGLGHNGAHKTKGARCTTANSKGFQWQQRQANITYLGFFAVTLSDAKASNSAKMATKCIKAARWAAAKAFTHSSQHLLASCSRHSRA